MDVTRSASSEHAGMSKLEHALKQAAEQAGTNTYGTPAPPMANVHHSAPYQAHGQGQGHGNGYAPAGYTQAQSQPPNYAHGHAHAHAQPPSQHHPQSHHTQSQPSRYDAAVTSDPGIWIRLSAFPAAYAESESESESAGTGAESVE
ncbi:hypothetical protein H2199_005096 [Coniosporium tulheliwenetii]|uniref:Uncharacterized protein n=1 Tax=Coniosporium tulheliwenetii TaxID=3383036 RepID=A0ACC2Z2Q3_9PEZI|nr:hypothetical protein H2199_005096 [Cladosporium sp. JES 115]